MPSASDLFSTMIHAGLQKLPFLKTENVHELLTGRMVDLPGSVHELLTGRMVDLPGSVHEHDSLVVQLPGHVDPGKGLEVHDVVPQPVP